jgi:hypothetical protein
LFLCFRWVAIFILLRHKMANCVSIKQAVLASVYVTKTAYGRRDVSECVWRTGDVVLPRKTAVAGAISVPFTARPPGAISVPSTARPPGAISVPSTARPPPPYYAVLWSNPGLRGDSPAAYLNTGTPHAFVFWFPSVFYFCGFD